MNHTEEGVVRRLASRDELVVILALATIVGTGVYLDGFQLSCDFAGEDTVIGGVVVRVASDILEKRRASLSDALSSTAKRLPSLLGAGMLSGVLVILGLICLVVPGIIVAIMFSLITPTIIIERIGVLESLSRSRKLIKQRWLKTFAYLAVIVIILAVTYSISSGVGVKGGQTRHWPYPSHPNWHFNRTQPAVSTSQGQMMSASFTPDFCLAASHNSLSLSLALFSVTLVLRPTSHLYAKS